MEGGSFTLRSSCFIDLRDRKAAEPLRGLHWDMKVPGTRERDPSISHFFFPNNHPCVPVSLLGRYKMATAQL